MSEFHHVAIWYCKISFLSLVCQKPPRHVTQNALYLRGKCSRELLLYILRHLRCLLHVFVYVFDIFYVIWKYICTRSHRSRSVCLLMNLLKTKRFMIFPLNMADIIEIPLLSFLGRLSFSHVLCLRRFVTSLSLRGPNVPSVYMNPAHKSFYRPIRPHHSAKPINGFTSLIMYFGGLQRAAEYQLSLHCDSRYRPTA